jgi:hypothetical protein
MIKPPSSLRSILRYVDCVLESVTVWREGRTEADHRRADGAWNIDYRTAGAFRCLYVGASTAWGSPDPVLPASDHGERIFASSLTDKQV